MSFFNIPIISKETQSCGSNQNRRTTFHLKSVMAYMMNISYKISDSIEHIESEEIIFNFFHCLHFWFPLQPINTSSKPKHTWLIEDFSETFLYTFLSKYLQTGLAVKPFFNSTHYKCMETPSCHNNQTKD